MKHKNVTLAEDSIVDAVLLVAETGLALRIGERGGEASLKSLATALITLDAAPLSLQCYFAQPTDPDIVKPGDKIRVQISKVSREEAE